MRAVESWQTNRQVAASIQRIPVLIAAPLAAGAAPEMASWGEAKGSPGELAAAGIELVMQCSKQRFRNLRAEAVAECRGCFQAKTGPRRLARLRPREVTNLPRENGRQNPTARSWRLCQDR